MRNPKNRTLILDHLCFAFFSQRKATNIITCTFEINGTLYSLIVGLRTSTRLAVVSALRLYREKIAILTDG